MPKIAAVNMEEMSGTLNRAGKTMTALLAAIATISLIVGGIGIMNIMLFSVTERTRWLMPGLIGPCVDFRFVPGGEIAHRKTFAWYIYRRRMKQTIQCEGLA